MTTTPPTRIGKTTVAACVGSIFAQLRHGSFIKRLMIGFRPPEGAVGLNLETHLYHIEVKSVLEQPLRGRTFPGHDRINHTLGTLRGEVSQVEIR